jgi:hypothetical protein
VTDFPAIMSAPMIRAILREVREPGTGKTCTRRLAWTGRKAADGHGFRPSPWQRIKVGDRLYVREAFCIGDDPPRPCYRATEGSEADLWKPSIHLPRRLSRLTLHVTGTKIERLQDITEADAQAEGVEAAVGGFDHDGGPLKTHRTGFVRIWGVLHGTDSWLANPWVMAVFFRPVLANIDSLEIAA